MQSQKGSLVEAISGTIIGLITSFAIQLTIYPALGITVSIGENLIITAVFFVVSIIRSYLVRRLFNKIFKKDEGK
tara:strand:+ start:309 stop:533 length:225 start_codon:yes stop_codon:yes gene_type:complete